MRSVVAIVVSLVLSSACAKKSAPPPATPAAEEKPKPPTQASKRPFFWGIQVRDGDDVSDYTPDKTAQAIPMPGSDWKCVHGGLKSALNNEGDYMEIRDVVCKLASGHAVGGRTVCYREPTGVVFEDTQVLVLADANTTLKLVVACTEKSMRSAEPAAPPPTPPASNPATPYFEAPKSIDL